MKGFNHPKLCVSKQVKVSKEVSRVESLPKEFQTGRLGPGWQAGGEQAQVQVHGVKENCPHLGVDDQFFKGKNLHKHTPKSEFQL